MGTRTKIRWCDSTLNFWEGCAKVSPGCANCYAEARDKRFYDGKHWGAGKPRFWHESAVKAAFRLNHKPWICDHCGVAQRGALSADEGCDNRDCPSNLYEQVLGLYHRRRIFSLSLGDWLDPEVPAEWLARMLDTIRQCQDVNWLLCTKRPELWEERFQKALWTTVAGAPSSWICDWQDGKAPKNVCILASTENQKCADERIPHLLKIPAVIHGLSCEPLLESINLRHLLGFKNADGAEISWCIVGGESGPNARPCNVEWIRSIRDQCKQAGVPSFVKQLGSNPWMRQDDGRGMELTPLAIKHSKGGDPAEWPDDLRVQQWPEVSR